MALYYNYDSDLGVSFMKPGEYYFGTNDRNGINVDYYVIYKIHEGKADTSGYSIVNEGNKQLYLKKTINYRTLDDMVFHEYSSSVADNEKYGKSGIYVTSDDKDNRWEYIYVFNDNIYVTIDVTLSSIHNTIEGNWYAHDNPKSYDVSTIRLPKDIYDRIFEFDVIETEKYFKS